MLGALLSVACSDYSPVPKGSTFEREADRISDNLNKPVPTVQGLKPTEALGGSGGSGQSQQPFILGQGANSDLLQGLTNAPVNVELRFDDAEIGEVATTILGDVLKRPYVLDTTLKGRVSLRISRSLSQRALMEALQQAVAKVGGDIRREGTSYQIVNATTNKIDDQRIAQLRAANSSVSIVPLRAAKAGTVADLVRAMYPSAQITVDESHNLLIIGGAPPQRAQMASAAELLDVGGVNSQTVAVYPLSQANAGAVADELRKVYPTTTGVQGSPVDFVPMARNNSVLVIARDRATLSKVGELIRGLDRSRSAGRRMYVVQLQHARAPILATVLRESLGLPPIGTAPSSTPPSINATSGQPSSMSILPSAGSAPLPPGGAGTAPASLTGAVPTGSNDPGSPNAAWELENVPLRIVANADTNSLVVFATPGEFTLLQEAVRRLDAMPLQVLIEATIMDVTLNDSLQFGVQAFLQQTTSAGNLVQAGVTASNFATMGATSTGFNFLFSSGSQVQAAINALRAVTKVNVLSSPQVVTLDNQKAKLEVGQQVPITTQTTTNTTTNSPAIVNSISYVQTGVILTVTPRVNSTGGVDLEIRQEVTDAPPPTNTLTPTPTLNRRVIETRISVQSAQTVALGGLITESLTDDRARVPLLGDIPVVGWLFGQTTVARNKRELLVFLTPTVFGSPEEARNFSLDLRRRIDTLWHKEGSSRRKP